MKRKNLLTPADTDIVLFEGESVRREWYNDERYYPIVDVISVLVQSKNPQDYVKKLRSRDPELQEGWGQIVTLLTVQTNWGPQQVSCANTAGILRIIQSIPSKKAEPFKQWLAMLGIERIEEANDPELGIFRARERAIIRYKQKWWSDDEIKRRLSMIDTRVDLTDEYKSRGIEGKEYGILTNYWYSIFGKTAQDIKSVKGFWKNDNIRDHMNKTEGLLTELTEETSKTLIQEKDAKWFNEIVPCVQEAVKIMSSTKEKIEDATGKPVLSDFNRLSDRQKTLRQKEKLNKKCWISFKAKEK